METFNSSTVATEEKTTLLERTVEEPTLLCGLLDLSPIEDGDEFRVAIHIKIKPNGEWRRWGNEVYKDKQECPALRITDAPTGFAFRISIQKLKGENRAFDWLITVK